MTPEEFAQLQPGDKIALFGCKLDLQGNPYIIKGNITSKSADLTNNGMAVNPEYWTLVSKAKIKPKFEIGKQYKSKLGLDIVECIAIANNGFAILKRKSSHIFEVNPETNQNWEEYIPPVIHKAYVHWFRWNNGSIGSCILESKKDNPCGHPALYVQEVSFEEKKDA